MASEQEAAQWADHQKAVVTSKKLLNDLLAVVRKHMSECGDAEIDSDHDHELSAWQAVIYGKKTPGFPWNTVALSVTLAELPNVPSEA